MMFPTILAPLALVALTACGVDPTFRYQPPQKLSPTGRFEVSNVPTDVLAKIGDKDGLKKAFFVGVDAKIPLLGTHGITGDTIWFTPRFPPAPDVDHIIRLDLNAPGRPWTTPLLWRWKLYPKETPAPMVVAVYPTTETIPENILRFYLQFSVPMKRGQAPGKIRILDNQGKEIELAFLELDEELWDAGQTRLTLLIDPGRIKRGVKPLEEVGPVFEAGKTYTLEVDGTVQDDAGKTLGIPYRKSLKIGPAVRERIQPQAWKIVAPQAPNGVLEVQLDRPLDHALLMRQLKVQTQTGVPVDGIWQIPPGEKLARFRPFNSWEKGIYHLVPGADLEDAAGNRTDRVFDAPGGENPVKPVPHRAFTYPGK